MAVPILIGTGGIGTHHILWEQVGLIIALQLYHWATVLGFFMSVIFFELLWFWSSFKNRSETPQGSWNPALDKVLYSLEQFSQKGICKIFWDPFFSVLPSSGISPFG